MSPKWGQEMSFLQEQPPARLLQEGQARANQNEPLRTTAGTVGLWKASDPLAAGEESLPVALASLETLPAFSAGLCLYFSQEP